MAARPELFAGRRVGVVISGGNIDARLLAYVLLREQVREGRLLVIRMDVPDRPGSLARIVSLVGEAQGNIVDVAHSRLLTSLVAKRAGITLTVETRDRGHSGEIMKKLRAEGLDPRIVEPQA
jgi:threonine dehydratase